jgi:hypothetical protein
LIGRGARWTSISQFTLIHNIYPPTHLPLPFFSLFPLFPTLQIAISIADYAAISPRFALAGAAILTASLLGWLMPLVANIVPIQVFTHWSQR